MDIPGEVSGRLARKLFVVSRQASKQLNLNYRVKKIEWE